MWSTAHYFMRFSNFKCGSHILSAVASLGQAIEGSQAQHLTAVVLVLFPIVTAITLKQACTVVRQSNLWPYPANI